MEATMVTMVMMTMRWWDEDDTEEDMMEEVDMAGNLFLGTRAAGSGKRVEDQIFEGAPVHVIEEEEEDGLWEQ